MIAYTISQQGNGVLLQCSDGNSLATEDWNDAIPFLLTPTDFAVVYGLDNFFDTLTNLLDKKLKDKVMAGGRNVIENRLIYYLQGKMFGLNYINFFDCKRYASEPVKNVAELYELGIKVVNAYKKMGLEVTKLTSPIAVFSDKLASIPYPRAADLPKSALPLIDSTAKTMTREWREIYRLGHFDKNEITDYDVVRCYPSIVAELPDLSNATFFSSPTLPQTYSWGELKGNLTITKDITPFYHENTNGFPVGNLGEQSITTDLLWLLNKYELGHFEMSHGDFFLLPPKYNLPFKETMESLYKVTLEPDYIMKTIGKGIAVAIWGKFAERYEERLGDFFNSVYARMTTSRASVKVASFIYHNHLENDVVSILVDGLLATKRIPITNVNKMGSWKMNEPSNALVASLLYQWTSDKRPNMKTYPEMIELIKQKPNSGVIADVDLRLLEYSRKFAKLPKNFSELMANKYTSEPIKV